MSYKYPPFKHWLLCLSLCLAALVGSADTLELQPDPSLKFRLQPHLSAWEDKEGTASPGALLEYPERFIPLQQLAYTFPTSVYWLKLPLYQEAETGTPLTLYFSHLTFVDAFLYRDGKLAWHRKAGAFRPRSSIIAGDGRFHLALPSLNQGYYTLLIRVHHTKGYQPYFDFALQEREAYRQAMYIRERADAWSQGAVAIFLLYTLLSWWGSRYRPYLWLGLFIAGVGMYSLCSGRYFIDWFFPENPAFGWLFNGPFLHLGLLGFYGLVISFWELPQYNPSIYRFGKVCMVVLVAVSVSGLCINYFTGNFNLVNSINLWAFALPFCFISALLFYCYRRLNRAQKYLYYGILLFIINGLFLTLSSALLKEQSLLLAPDISNFTTLAVFLLFSTGLKEALRQHEVDKGAVLEQLARLQQEQNTILENTVAVRTEALQHSNQLLLDQTALLAQRNHTIETLINELSHRVKNNLQLLYSLVSLQLPNITDQKATHILKGNLSRIKAMMLVNQKLDYVEAPRPLNLSTLVGELASHLQDIYDRQQKVKVDIRIPPAVELHSRQVLSIGLILTELLTNSFKYAFPKSPFPRITIQVTFLDQYFLEWVYTDNGTGMPHQPNVSSSSMGISLVKDLVRQLRGTLLIEPDEGLTYTVKIPIEPQLAAATHKFATQLK